MYLLLFTFVKDTSGTHHNPTFLVATIKDTPKTHTFIIQQQLQITSKILYCNASVLELAMINTSWFPFLRVRMLELCTAVIFFPHKIENNFRLHGCSEAKLFLIPACSSNFHPPASCDQTYQNVFFPLFILLECWESNPCPQWVWRWREGGFWAGRRVPCRAPSRPGAVARVCLAHHPAPWRGPVLTVGRLLKVQRGVSEAGRSLLKIKGCLR